MGDVTRKLWDREKADVTGARLRNSNRTAVLNPDVGQASSTRGRWSARLYREFTSTVDRDTRYGAFCLTERRGTSRLGVRWIPLLSEKGTVGNDNAAPFLPRNQEKPDQGKP